MMQQKARQSLLLAIVLSFSPACFAANTAPVARQGSDRDGTTAKVVARYLQAIGGIDSLKKIQNKRIAYRVHLFGRDSYSRERRWSRPDTMRQGSPGGAEYLLTEGGVTSRVTPDGRSEMPAAVSADLAKIADMDGPLVDSEKKGISIEYFGSERYDMSELQQLKLTYADGVQWDLYFDERTGLLRRMRVPSFLMIDNEIVRGPDSWTYYHDYRSVGGIKIPHLWIQLADDHVHAFVLEEVDLEY